MDENRLRSEKQAYVFFTCVVCNSLMVGFGSFLRICSLMKQT